MAAGRAGDRGAVPLPGGRADHAVDADASDDSADEYPLEDSAEDYAGDFAARLC